MSIDTLEKLFGGAAKVKIMKLFLFNRDSAFDLMGIAERPKVSKETARRECGALQKMKLIRAKSFLKNFKSKAKKRGKEKVKQPSIKKRVNGWVLNRDFPYLD